MSTTQNSSSILPPAPSTESFLLRDLAQRIRALRKSRSLTRKNLSQLANVSERHLAQLESGEGNISILLLNRIATALNTPLADLFASESQSFPAENSPRHKRIALIGLRGAGKSTLGEKLAATRNVPFIELDREIEKETGMPLADIFLSTDNRAIAPSNAARSSASPTNTTARSSPSAAVSSPSPKATTFSAPTATPSGSKRNRKSTWTASWPRETSAPWPATTARWTICAVFSTRASRSIAKPT